MIVTLGTALLWSSGTEASSAGRCVSAEAQAALTCSGPGLSQSATQRTPLKFNAPKPEGPTKSKTDPKVNRPKRVTQPPPRGGPQLREVARQLLIQEISNVTRLYKTTPLGHRDRPRLMRRLADNYVELEAAAFREQIEAEDGARRTKQRAPQRAAELRKKALATAKVVRRARQRAIAFYGRLAEQHPQYCQFPQQSKLANRGCTDEVLYYLAFEHERARHPAKARDAYLQLIGQWPRSKYVPHAFLAFGELYFAEGQRDPTRWPLAKLAYQKVLKHKAPGNKLWGYAQYKLGYVHWNQGRHAQALDAFVKVIRLGARYPKLPNTRGLVEAARRDLVPVYAQQGNPKRAHDFFRPLSGDRAGQSARTFAMMEELGRVMMDTGHYADAIALYRDLLDRNEGASSCDYRGQISKATMAHHSGKKTPVVAALKDQLAAYQASAKASYPAASKQRCANVTAALLSETAMAWHIEAVGSGGVKGTDNPKTKAAAAQLYRWASAHFTARQFASFTFQRIVKEDWPTLGSLRYAHADLLYDQQEWAQCGPAFDAAYEADPQGPHAAEALFAAAVCWRKLFDSMHAGEAHRRTAGTLTPGSERYQPRQLGEAQEHMLRAFDRYVCNLRPPKGNPVAMEQYVEVKFARARTYYEAAHYDKAALAFRDVALHHSQFEAGIYAANLYLESTHIMRDKWGKDSCVADMGQAVPKLVKLYCAQGDDEARAAQCGIIAQVGRDLDRITAETLVRTADRGGPEATDQYVAAGERYVKIWRRHGEQACRDELPSCAGMEEVLYNAAQAFQAAHLLARAIRLRELLVHPDTHLANTAPARRAKFELGANYQAIAVYDKAAGWYEQYALENPKKARAPEALSDAVVLRLGLGQPHKAQADAKHFTRLYGASKPQQAAQIAFAIGAHHVDRGAHRTAERTLGRALSQIEAHGSADVRLQAHAMLGRVQAELENHGKAATHFGRVLSQGRDIAKLKQAIHSGNDPADRRQRRLGKALMAIGEARFYFAERERAKAAALVFPKYQGSGTRKDVERFVQTKVGAWLDAKVPAIQRATAAYAEVVKLNDPEPPPRWAIAAGASVGELWGELVTDFIRAPYPRQWDQPGTIPGSQPPTLWHELRAKYQAELARKAGPFKKTAKQAYITCLEYGILYQYFDGELRSCEQWLADNYPSEFHVVDEFRGAPTRVSSGLAERPSALAVDGRPVETTRPAAPAQR
ncbi:MAG: hypothetical protein JRI68_07455 [Deltaproteobacteria bacterium]|nr:hypothetical protein [Deltaproteobacteria bacterium]